MHRYIILVSFIALTGCGKFSIPDIRMGSVDKIAPDSWTASSYARGGVDRVWVKHYGDGRLERLVSEALSSNPDM